MITIDACLICKNEMPYVDALLRQLSSCMDHVYVVDTGSTDGFVEKSHLDTLPANVHVYEHEWTDDFSEARNISFSYGNSEMIFWCDCDDVLSDDLVKAIQDMKSTKCVNDVPDWIDIPYLYYVDRPGTEFRRMRLCKRSNNPTWICPIHENIDFNTNLAVQLFPDNCKILHEHRKDHTDRNLEIFHGIDKNKFQFSGRDLYYYAVELYSQGWFVPAYTLACECIERFDTHPVDRINAVRLLDLLSNYYLSYKPTRSPIEMAELSITKFHSIRPDILCIIARDAFNQQDWWKAILYYLEAHKRGKPSDGFDSFLYDGDYHDYEPLLQVSICYYNLGNLRLAAKYNNELLSIYKDCPQAIHNSKYYLNDDEKI